ncbi:MAG: MarR family transcriptional regulator [Steroidobacteraceae bacterium]|nr:MarR family transcriptional regulator [Steroidobacteraceae bacterium]
MTLKPQDLLVLFAMSARGEPGTYADLAAHTGLAASAVHAALKRAATCGLVRFQDRQPLVLKPQLREFVLHGAKYAFPAVFGRLARGVPTSYAAAPLNAEIAPSSDPPPVWPHKTGTARGIALAPLYPSVPEAALRDERLYALLALFDALRSGQARERNRARSMLEERLQ